MPELEFIDISAEIREDPRGISFFPWQQRVRDPATLLQTFHLISIRPGQTRGNHLHPGHLEWLYSFHGAGVFVWETAAGEVREQLVSGNRTLVRIAPGVAHALKNPGPEILYLIAWRERVGEGAGEPETVPRLLRATH